MQDDKFETRTRSTNACTAATCRKRINSSNLDRRTPWKHDLNINTFKFCSETDSSGRLLASLATTVLLLGPVYEKVPWLSQQITIRTRTMTPVESAQQKYHRALNSQGTDWSSNYEDQQTMRQVQMVSISTSQGQIEISSFLSRFHKHQNLLRYFVTYSSSHLTSMV